MKRRLFLSLASFSLFGALCWAQGTKPVTVTFYHTSDLHEHAEPMAKIARFVAEKKKADPNVLFIDSGDWFNKGDLTPLNTRGEAMTEMIAACGYDAVIAGNHEDTFGTRRFAELVDKYGPPLVSINGTWPEDVKPKTVKPYAIFELKGVTVAVIGTTTIHRGNAVDELLEVRPIVPAVKKVIGVIDRLADIIVLLTHVGPPEDLKTARACPRLDVIFGGHHHKRYQKLDFKPGTKTVIQHSGAFGSHVGELVLTWDGAKISDRSMRSIPVTATMPDDPKVKAVHDKYLAAGVREWKQQQAGAR